MVKLLSVTMLHRHGARGPGESELKPWPSSSAIKSQWLEDDLENITRTGRIMCVELGRYIHSKYIFGSIPMSSDVRYRWYCSKASRARESGSDVVNTINTLLSSEKVPAEPFRYDIDHDYYFRPWKIFAESTASVKNKIGADDHWLRTVNDNREFLRRIFDVVGALEDVQSKGMKSLWSTTYLQALRECEIFWPRDNEWPPSMSESEIDVRKHRSAVLNSPIDKQDWQVIKSLATWVFERRFLHSGFQLHMGARLALEMLQNAMDPDTVNIFSGHDYSILVVLASMGIIKHLPSPMSFAAYLVFELWDGPPPTRSAYNSRASTMSPRSSNEARIAAFNEVDFNIDELPICDVGTLSRDVSSWSVVTDAYDEAPNFDVTKALEEDDDSPVDYSADSKSSTTQLAFVKEISEKLQLVAESKYAIDHGPSDSKSDCRILRIILNGEPFLNSEGDATIQMRICKSNEQVLAELTIPSVMELLRRLQNAVDDIDSGRSGLIR